MFSIQRHLCYLRGIFSIKGHLWEKYSILKATFDKNFQYSKFRQLECTQYWKSLLRKPFPREGRRVDTQLLKHFTCWSRLRFCCSMLISSCTLFLISAFSSSFFSSSLKKSTRRFCSGIAIISTFFHWQFRIIKMDMIDRSYIIEINTGIFRVYL